MNHTSLTHRHIRARCPKRYFYRYLHRHSQAITAEKIHVQHLSCLYGHRELLGHLVHEALAKLINHIVEEGYSPHDAHLIECRMLEEYDLAVEASRRGILSEDRPAIAELVNGADIEESIKDGPSLLRHYFQTGIQIVHLLGIKRGDSARTEISDKLATPEGTYHLRVDLILERGDQMWVIDWKTKADISRQDRNQLKYYLEWTRRKFGLKPLQLVGIIASLNSGELEKVPFDIFHAAALTASPPAPSVLSSSRPTRPVETPTKEEKSTSLSYPAVPSIGLCSACPYASICQQATLPATSAKELEGIT